MKGTFILLRVLRSHAIFVDSSEPPKAYGVLALNSPFEDLVSPPAMVEAVLLPFRDRIVYDGIICAQPVHFGPGYRQSFDDAYQRAKLAFGLITTLPFTPPEGRQSEEELLCFYLKSARNRQQHWEETQGLLERNPRLLPVYYQELGKRQASTYKRRFREQGLAPAWSAILNDLLLTSGSTRDQVTKTIAWLVPPEKQNRVFVFHWKP